MLKSVRWLPAALILAPLVPHAAPAAAQTTPPAATQSQNPLLDAARAAFDALPLDDRKAIQNDLVWASTYNGTLDGQFGKGSFDAIVGFELKSKLKADGILDPRERSALAAEAEKLRGMSGYAVVADAKTGLRIGLPVKAFETSGPRGRGTAWTRKDNRISVATEAYRPGEADLQAMFDQLKAEQAGRKVTYAIWRQTWFVVAGETQTHKFYTRYATGPAGVVGYTYGFEKSTPDGDRIAVVLSNSFDPFPGTTAVAAGPAPATAAPPAAVTAAPPPAAATTVTAAPAATKPAVSTTPPPPAAIPAAAEKPAMLAASGLVVAQNRVVTVSAALDACRAPSLRGKPARVVATDGTSGLVLLEGETGPATPVALRSRPVAAGEALIVLGQGERSGQGLMVGPGEAVAAPEGSKAGQRVLTPLQPGGLGATVTDRSGVVVGLVAGLANEPRRIAGVAPEAPWSVAGSGALAAFLAGQGIAVATAPEASAARSAGQIATALKGAVVQIGCGR
ncbi:peptidoglycan-binding domain-containing protein [Prosthecomicrobium hirschii]|uniref:peptidoglycan-binding domain-containing protein n=1 Tax=Prosthecodimorpha hirschii TaxID=665126 RepID=UPI0022209E35|nr:peptidoglycan-binding domain-containing protein [Prosthecomicrobium hirschii]MCW1840338.1 peptidoglycan-binding protein [Prosthecomicrobium hirschii]